MKIFETCNLIELLQRSGPTVPLMIKTRPNASVQFELNSLGKLNWMVGRVENEEIDFDSPEFGQILFQCRECGRKNNPRFKLIDSIDLVSCFSFNMSGLVSLFFRQQSFSLSGL